MSTSTYCRDCSEVVRRLNLQILPVQQSEYAEFAVQFEQDLTLMRKDPDYELQMHDLSCALCALINTSGGIIQIRFKSYNPMQLENWKDAVRNRMVLFTGKDLYHSSVTLGEIPDNQMLEVHVSQGNCVVTVHSNFYIRDGCSSIELRGVDLVRKALESQKEYPYDNKPEKWTDLTYGQAALEQNESSTLEYKIYKCIGVQELLLKMTTGISGSKLEKTLFAFPNQRGGGTIIIGVSDDKYTGRKRVFGQKLSLNEQEKFKNEFATFMRRGMYGEARIWKDRSHIPREGKEWMVTFIPVVNTPNNESYYLIHIHVNHFPGGVYASMPEMYTVLSDGRFASVDYDIWQKCTTSTPDLHHRYIHSIPETPSLSTSDEQPNITSNEILPLEGVEEYLPQLAEELRDWTRKHGKNDPSVSWTKHSRIWEMDKKIRKEICGIPKVSELCNANMLTPRTPILYFPSEEYLLKGDVGGTLKQALQDVSKYYKDKPAVAFAGSSLIALFPLLGGITPPQSHVLDIFVMTKDTIDVWTICQDSKSNDQSNYLKSLLRQLKRLLLIRFVNMAVTIKGFVKILGQRDHSCTETLSSTGDKSLKLLQNAVASILLQGNSLLRNRLGEEYLVALTKGQMEQFLTLPRAQFTIIDGPPGSGKTLMAFTLIDNLKRIHNLRSEQIKYICPNQALANYAKSQNLCSVGVCTGKNLMQIICEDVASGVRFFIFDDGHRIRCRCTEWTALCDVVNKENGPKVVIFIDSSYQNYGPPNEEMNDAVINYKRKHRWFSYVIHAELHEMLRNSLKIFSFFKANAEENGAWLQCSHNVLGDDIHIHSHRDSDLQLKNSDNPIIGIVTDILKCDSSGHLYQRHDIAILVGVFILRRRDIIKAIENALKEALHIDVQRASDFPVKLMIVDSLRNFVGLDSKSCVVIMDEDSINDMKLKLFTVSRGILRVDYIITYSDTGDRSVTEKMHISREDMWEKKSLELVHQLQWQLSQDGGVNDGQESFLQQIIPHTPKWKQLVLLVLGKQLCTNKELQHIQNCIAMMIPKAWHLELYEYQGRHLVCGQSEGADIADRDVLEFPVQYPNKIQELVDLSSWVIKSAQSTDAVRRAVKVILVSFQTLLKEPQDSMHTAAVVGQRLSVTQLAVQLVALEALATVMTDSDMRTAAIQQGVVDVLLGIMNQFDRDDKVKKKVLEALGALIKDDTARSQAADQGLVENLMGILDQQDTDDQLKLRVLDVLSKLKEKSADRTEETVVNGLLEILKQNDNLVEDAMEVLHTMVQDNNMRTAAIKQGVGDVLLGVINQPHKGVRVRLEVLRALSTMKERSAVRMEEINRGLIDGLLEILTHDPDNKEEADALKMLHRMMADSDMMTAATQQQVLAVLLGIIELPRKTSKVKQTVLRLLHTMKEHSSPVRAEEIDQCVVDGLLKILGQPDNDNQVQEEALDVLDTAMKDSNIRTAAIQQGVVGVLLSVMKQHGNHVTVRLKVLQVLHTVKKDSTARTEQIHQEVVVGLLEILQQHITDVSVQEDTLRVLDTVMKDSEMRTSAIQLGVVGVLLGVINQPHSSVRIKLKAAEVLHALKKDDIAMTETIDRGVVCGLLDILRRQSSSNVSVQESTLEVLMTVMEDRDMMTAAIQQGVVDVLLVVLKQPDEDNTVRLKIIEVLCAVKKDSTERTDEADRGLIDGLLDILRQYDTDKWVQRDALGVLHTVMGESSMRRAATQQGVVDVLLEILKLPDKDDEVQRDALKVLHTITTDRDTRTAAIQQGVIDVLLGVIKQTDKHVVVQREALKVLHTVTKDRDMRTVSMQQGVFCQPPKYC